MMETFCGRSCDVCGQKEVLGCPGCKAGPGRPFGGECELARCCRQKGHESCDTCLFQGRCATLRDRNRQLEYRQRRMEEERERAAEIARRAPALGKWLRVLFWLVIAANIIGLAGSDYFRQAAPGIYLLSRTGALACQAAYGTVLLMLSREEHGYRTAGVCALAAMGANALVAVISGTGDPPDWILLLAIPAGLLALIGMYGECNANSQVLDGVDNCLAEKWTKLWKWYVGCVAAMFGSILILAMPLLGGIVLLGATIGDLVVNILKIVYLYRTSKIFGMYAADSRERSM